MRWVMNLHTLLKENNTVCIAINKRYMLYYLCHTRQLFATYTIGCTSCIIFSFHLIIYKTKKAEDGDFAPVLVF